MVNHSQSAPIASNPKRTQEEATSRNPEPAKTKQVPRFSIRIVSQIPG